MREGNEFEAYNLTDGAAAWDQILILLQFIVSVNVMMGGWILSCWRWLLPDTSVNGTSHRVDRQTTTVFLYVMCE